MIFPIKKKKFFNHPALSNPPACIMGFLCGSAGKKNLPAMWETWVKSLGWKDPLEKGKAAHSTILTCKVP